MIAVVLIGSKCRRGHPYSETRPKRLSRRWTHIACRDSEIWLVSRKSEGAWARGSSRQAGRHRDCCARNGRIQDRDVTPVNPRSGRIATIIKEGTGVVKTGAAARMPLGSSAGRAARPRPDAGPRLADGRPSPPRGGTGGRTGPPSPATTRLRPEAGRGLTPTPAGSHHSSQRAIADPSSPAGSDSSPPSTATALSVIRCRFIFSGKNDELTPDFPTN